MNINKNKIYNIINIKKRKCQLEHQQEDFTVAKKLEVIEAYESRFDFNLTKTALFFDLGKGVLSRLIKTEKDYRSFHSL